MNSLRMLGSFVLAAAAFPGVLAAAIVYQTHQSASSQVDADGTTQVRDDDAADEGFASSQAIWPPGDASQLPQARTAARSREAEIAANARVFSDTFSRRFFDLALSQAVYAIDVDHSVVAFDAGIDFFVPPSYVEIVTNAELRFDELNSTFVANLEVCHSAFCTLSDSVFYFQVDAGGSFAQTTHSMILNGDPSIDLTPLMHPPVSDTTSGLLRTYLVEFPAFRGHVDLERQLADVPLRVEYILQARAWGQTGLNSAIASINDPFLLDTDPVQQGPPLLLTLTPVPEPAAGIMLLIGMATMLIGCRTLVS
jgi:hypothetical protein